jgi:hypothetical protein
MLRSRLPVGQSADTCALLLYIRAVPGESRSTYPSICGHDSAGGAGWRRLPGEPLFSSRLAGQCRLVASLTRSAIAEH